MRVEELVMSLTGCNTWENKPCTSTGQQSTAIPGCGIADEQAPEVREWESRQADQLL